MKCDYRVENDKAVIHIFYRRADGSRGHFIDDTFVPHFYVEASDLASQMNVQIFKGLEIGVPDGLSLVQINTKLPTDVPMERMRYPRTWQAKTFFNDLYLAEIMKGKTLDEMSPWVMILDIECEREAPGKYFIVKIGYYSPADNTYHALYFSYEGHYPTIPFTGELELQSGITIKYELRLFDDERSMIDAWISDTEKIGPDVFAGWNVHFDMTTIFDRSRELQITTINNISPLGEVHLRKGFQGRKELYVGGCSIFDLCAAAVNLLSPQEAFTLRFIAKKFLGFEKRDYRNKIGYLRRNDPDELIRYNMGDVWSCVALMQEKQLFNHFYERSLEAGCNLDSTFPMWKWLQFFLLRDSHLKLPTESLSLEISCEGPRILDTVPGVHDDTICIDFEGLYPAIVKTWRMSPENLAPRLGFEVKVLPNFNILNVGNGTRFYDNPNSVWPNLMTYLLAKKLHYNEIMESLHLTEEEKPKNPAYHRRNGYKLASVAATGLLKWKGFEIYCPEILNAIYYIAREIVDWVVTKIRMELHLEVIYGDTDSAFVKLKPETNIKELVEKVNKIVTDFCEVRGIKEHYFKIDVDYICKRIFFDTGQKRYALINDKGELVIRGFEGKKINTSPIGSGIQKFLLRLILETKSKEKVSDYLREMVTRIKSGEIPLAQIAAYHTLKKASVSAYKKRTPYMRGIDLSNIFRIEDGEFDRLEYMDTHQFIPIKVLWYQKSVFEPLKPVMPNPAKVKLLAFEMDEDYQKFIDHVNASGKAKITIDMDKVLDLNIVRRVEHILKALQWDLSYLWTNQPKLG